MPTSSSIVELAVATDAADKVTSTPADFLEHGFGNPAAFEVILAERDGAAAGMALYFFTFSTWWGRRGLYLQDLVVAESARQQGLGTLLMQQTARAAIAAGATHMRLSVDAANRRAQSLYAQPVAQDERAEASTITPVFEETRAVFKTEERLYMIAGEGVDDLAAGP